MAGAALNERSAGVFVISATPFHLDGSLDFESTDRLMDFYLGCGVRGITVLGVMGEATKMTDAESEAFVARVLRRVDGRVPVVVGVTNSALARVRALTAQSMDMGAAGVMLQPAPGLKGDEDVCRYFATAFEAITPEVPVVLQDYPAASGVHIAVEVWNRLVDDFPQLVMMKHEDFPGLGKLSRIRADEARDGRRRVSILVGTNGVFLPLELERGADGAMSGFAYPDMLARVCALFAAGRRDEAEDLFDAYLPLNRFEFQLAYGLAVRKEILRRRGAIRTATVRYPAVALAREDLTQLDRLMARAEACGVPLMAGGA